MGSIDFFRDEDVFDARLFAFDFLAFGIDEGDAVPIDDFDDAAGLAFGLPEDALILVMAEAGVARSEDEVIR